MKTVSVIMARKQAARRLRAGRRDKRQASARSCAARVFLWPRLAVYASIYEEKC